MRNLFNIEILAIGHFDITNRASTQAVRNRWRVYWNPEPGHQIVSGNKVFDLDCSVVIAIPPGVAIGQKLHAPSCEHLFIDVDGGLICNQINEIVAFKLENSTSDLLQKLRSCVKKGEVLHGNRVDFQLQLATRGLFYMILSEASQQSLLNPSQSTLLDRAGDLLMEHVQSGIKNSDLAELLSISESSLMKLFQKELRISPQKWLLNHRLEKASTMLIISDLSIEEIARQCGFCERSHFSRLFKRKYLIGPAKYRKTANNMSD